MDELERLCDNLPYFDKQKFIGRHLVDACVEMIINLHEKGLLKRE